MARPLWAEQHPDDWWRAAQEAIRGVLEERAQRGDSVRGIGLSGQMHGLVLLDEDNKVIRPALIWCDQRSQQQVDYINAKVGKAKVLEYIANPVLTGFTLPKLLWVRDRRAGAIRARPQNSAAERLLAFQADRRICDRGFRCQRHRAVRCGASPVVEARWWRCWGSMRAFCRRPTNRARSRER